MHRFYYAHVALWREPPPVQRMQEGSIPFVRARSRGVGQRRDRLAWNEEIAGSSPATPTSSKLSACSLVRPKRVPRVHETEGSNPSTLTNSGA